MGCGSQLFERALLTHGPTGEKNEPVTPARRPPADVPTPTKTWHELKVVIKGDTVEGYRNGKLYLTHQLTQPVSGKIGVWSKADSHMYIDDYRVDGGS